MIIVPSGSSPVLILSLIDEVTVGNNPVTGQTATVAIRRLSDGKWFDFVDVTWDTIATYALLDASNKQALTDNGDGTYGYAWNQATADASDEADYEMTFAVPSGTYQGMAHDTYSFRTKWAVAGDNMGTVTGVSGNVTGSVGSVTGAVGSVTSPVTVGTNNDKTNYALTSAYDAAKTAASASTVATAVWANDTRTLSSFGTLAADVASAVWSATTRTLSSFGTLAADVWASATRSLTDKANFTLSSDYDAAKTAASATNLATVDTVVDAIKAKTDNLPASPAATGAAMSLTSAERTALITALLGTSITFPDGNTKTLETIVEEVWAGTAGDYELAGTNWQIKWVDGTPAYVFELDSATAPTMRTRI